MIKREITLKLQSALKYGIVSANDVKLTDFALPGINMALQLMELSVLGSNVDEKFPFQDLVNKFINETHSSIIQYFQSVFNKVGIDKIRLILNASVNPPTDSEKESSNKQLIQFFINRNLNEAVKREISAQEALDKFLHWRSSVEWVFKQTKKGISVWIAKNNTNSQFPTMKFVLKVKCELKNCFQFIRSWEQSNPDVTQETLERIDEYHSEIYIKTTLPFPFSSRDYVMRRWEFEEPKRYTFFFYSVTRPDKPEIENIIRGHIFASGMIMEQDKEDPEYLILDHYSQADGKMKLPQWILNQQWRATVSGLKLLRENLDPSTKKSKKKNKKEKKT